MCGAVTVFVQGLHDSVSFARLAFTAPHKYRHVISVRPTASTTIFRLEMMIGHGGEVVIN